MGLANYKYQTDKGSIFFVKTDEADEWATARGTEPTGAPTESLTLKTSRTNTEFGGTARLGIWKRQPQQGQNAGPYNGACISPEPEAVKYIPILKPDHTIAAGATITVNGSSWKFSGKVVPESFF